MTNLVGRVVVVCLTIGALCRAAEPPHEWHVAPAGDDANPGTVERPFATLERAVEAARGHDRRRQEFPADIIRLAPGLHARSAPLLLDARDSKLVIRGPDDRAATLHAGRFIEAAAFVPVTDAAIRQRLDPAARARVVQLDLRAAGLARVARPPDVYHDGGGLPDLFIDEVPQPLARWPDEAAATMERVLDRGEPRRRGGVFIARDDRVSRWNVADGLWLEGYWRVPWDPAAIRVAAIEPATRRVDLAGATQGGIGSKYAPDGQLGDGTEPWWAVNVLEEIDRPGEWCIHLPSQRLYLWPPAGFGPATRVFVSGFSEPVVQIDDAEHVTLQLLSIAGGLGDGVSITGGRKALVVGCTLRCLGGTGVVIDGGRDHTVRSCDIHDNGSAGVRLFGGDRRTLAAAGHAVVNNDIHHVGRRRKTWAAAVHLGSLMMERGGHDADAVGCRVANNFLHDLPHSAVLYAGNDHVLERNEVCRVALTSADVGAFYTSHDWTSQGTVARHNLVHDCPRANAFYLDDGDSGDTVEENVVWRAASGVFLGGGHDNVIRRNVIVDCPVGIHVDSRGVARGYRDNPRLRGLLGSVPVDTPPWSDRYPALRRLLDPAFDAGRPDGITITGNVTVRCGTPVRQVAKRGDLAGCTITDQLDLGAGTGADDPRFAAEAAVDFRLGDGSAILRRWPDFPRDLLAGVGLQKDAYRKQLPDRRAVAARSLGAASGAIDSATDVAASDRRAEGAKGQGTAPAVREPVAAPPARLTVPRIFSDHMVLQRDKPLPVWGTAPAGAVVRVSFAGQTKSATAGADGGWITTLDPLPASREPRDLGIDAQPGGGLTVRDVLVGEVWLGSGQSNMAFPLRSNRDAAAILQAADLPELRFYTADERDTDTATTPPRSSWKTCTSQTAGDCSAVMFFLGRRLLEELRDVPVGVINASKGGTSIILWIDRDVQRAAPALEAAVQLDQQRHDETDLDKEMQAYRESKRFTDWVAAAEAARQRGAKPPPQPTSPEEIHRRWLPAGGWFRLRIAPLIPFGIRGIVWYQGEADASVAAGLRYREQLPALVGDWRTRWRDPALPFVVVQIPFWRPTARTAPAVREAQTRVLDLPNTGLVVTYDVGDPDDVHPADKTAIGDRLARWALGTQYGRSIETSGPVLAERRIAAGVATLRFRHAAGLHSRIGGPIRGFELAGADRIWHPAAATVEGDSIRVTAAAVPAPVAVRYAWLADPEQATLVNAADLPAGPFRSDDWPLP